MIFRLYLLVVVLGSAASLAGQVHNCDIYKGYLSGELSAWSKGIDDQEAKYARSGSSDDLYVLILSKYGYVGYLISLKRDSEARTVLGSAEKNVEKLSSDKSFAARASAMNGALIAMRISLNPLRATYLGMRSLRQMEEALKIDPDEPACWVEMGNARYHMPSVFGGSYSEAVRCFSQAITLFEKNPAMIKCNWHYLHALVWLAKSYEGMDDNKKAREVYEKILKTEPEFLWVKTELYPSLLKKM